MRTNHYNVPENLVIRIYVQQFIILFIQQYILQSHSDNGSKALIKQILYSLLIILLFSNKWLSVIFHDPEEPSIPSVTACHCPCSVMLKMRVRYGGFQQPFLKWLLELEERIEHSLPCDIFLKCTDKTFSVYKKYAHESIQGICSLILMLSYKMFFWSFTPY